jgi:thioredoxin
LTEVQKLIVIKVNVMKKNVVLFVGILLLSALGLQAQSKNKNTVPKSEYKPIQMTTKMFKELVFDYTTETEWNYKGDVPCVIDFYTVWCGPCKRIAPILEELSEQYKGKILVYKVNTEQNRELASAFQITSIPRVLFVPVKGRPSMVTGGRPKEFFEAQFAKLLNDKEKK